MRQRHFLLAGFLALLAAQYYCTSGSAPGKPQTDVLSAREQLIKYSLDSATAENEKTLWLSERETIISQLGDRDSTYIVKGFRLHRDDLKGMLDALGDSTKALHEPIWAMLGMRNDTLTLIFQTFDRATGKEVYYDFTSPCPPMCPE